MIYIIIAIVLLLITGAYAWGRENAESELIEARSDAYEVGYDSGWDDCFDLSEEDEELAYNAGYEKGTEDVKAFLAKKTPAKKTTKAKKSK